MAKSEDGNKGKGNWKRRARNVSFDRETKVGSEMDAGSGTDKKRLLERLESTYETEGEEKIKKKSRLEWQ